MYPYINDVMVGFGDFLEKVTINYPESDVVILIRWGQRFQGQFVLNGLCHLI